jgi:hypothetical protein
MAFCISMVVWARDGSNSVVPQGFKMAHCRVRKLLDIDISLRLPSLHRAILIQTSKALVMGL